MINEKTGVRLLEHPWQWLAEQPPGAVFVLFFLLAAVALMAYLLYLVDRGDAPSEEQVLQKEINLAKLRKELAELNELLGDLRDASQPNSN